MGQTLNIGRRVELISMDPHFQDISIGLYRQELKEGTAYLVHTYSHIDDAGKRIAFVVNAMCTLGGMKLSDGGLLHFPCWQEHALASKRVFLEACKLSSDSETEPRPMSILDKKTGLKISVELREKGVYRVTAEGEAKDKERRITFIAGALMKLGEMLEAEQSLDKVAFPCGNAHDAMLCLLLVRAPNVRAVLREQDMAAARGVLAAPSQQR